MTKVKETKEVVALEKYVDISEMKLVEGTSINVEELNKAFYALALDADKANKGSKAAGRRFRLNTTAISKAFLDMRKCTPRANSGK